MSQRNAMLGNAIAGGSVYILTPVGPSAYSVTIYHINERALLNTSTILNSLPALV